VAATKLGSLGATGSKRAPHPDLNRMGGVAWSRAKERALKTVRRCALDLVSSCRTPPGPGFAVPRRWPLAAASWRIPFPYEPTPAVQGRISEVEARHGRAPSRWTGRSDGDCGLRQTDSGDPGPCSRRWTGRQAGRPCSLSHGVASSTLRTLSELRPVPNQGWPLL